MTEQFELNLEEHLAILLSRGIRDFETSACGALSFIPAAGMLLAQHTHAPMAEIIILGSRDYSPFVTGKDFHYHAQRGQLDLFHISGIEIDRHGNFNLHVIGERDNPDVLMPGQYGTGMLYYAVPRIQMFRTEHTPRSFPETVSYISGAGTSPEGIARRTEEVRVITPMCIMVLNEETRLLELESINPGFTADNVQSNTGFDLNISDPIPVTAPITQTEVETLRRIVKPHMVESETYPELAQQLIRDPDIG